MALLNRDRRANMDKTRFSNLRTYSFRATEQDPVIDRMQTIMHDELGGKIKGRGLTEMHVRSGLATSTMSNWFVKRSTQKPNWASIVAFSRALGYDVALVRTGNKANGKAWEASGPRIIKRSFKS